MGQELCSHWLVGWHLPPESHLAAVQVKAMLPLTAGVGRGQRRYRAGCTMVAPTRMTAFCGGERREGTQAPPCSADCGSRCHGATPFLCDVQIQIPRL